LQDIQNALALRLYDRNNVFWPLAELTLYILEALQTWNAMTNFWRGDFVFPTVSNQTWYDLTTVANSLRPMNTAFTSLYQNLNAHLLEPLAGIASAQFTATEYANALAFRVNEMLGETGVTLTRSLIPATNGRITLPDGTFDVIRLAYLPAIPSSPLGGYGAGAYGIGPYGVGVNLSGYAQNTVLFRDDTWAAQAYEAIYLQNPPGMPLSYLMSTQPPISFDTDRAPGYGGQYEILTTNEASGATIPLPNDWTHLAKWGALAYLLATDSNARDDLRAKYCEGRYKLGKKMLQNTAALLALRVNNVPLQIDAVQAADTYNPAWQSEAAATPTNAYQAGLNLIALAPAPWSLASITATVVQNAPLPAGPSDYVQLSEDVLDTLLDYAQHLAMFKCGGAEFTSSMPLLENFMREAAVANSKLMEMGAYTDYLLGLSNRNEAANPRLDPEVLA
jgi:hypothetical protein